MQVQFGNAVYKSQQEGGLGDNLRGTVQNDPASVRALGQDGRMAGMLDYKDRFVARYRNPQQGLEADVEIGALRDRPDGFKTQEYKVTVAWDPTKTVAAKGFTSGRMSDEFPFYGAVPDLIQDAEQNLDGLKRYLDTQA